MKAKKRGLFGRNALAATLSSNSASTISSMRAGWGGRPPRGCVACDPARVRIMNTLATAGESVCVCELVEPLGLSQPTVSHHMKKLFEVGLVDREQRGKWAYFSLRRDAVEKLAAIADLKGVCC